MATVVKYASDARTETARHKDPPIDGSVGGCRPIVLAGTASHGSVVVECRIALAVGADHPGSRTSTAADRGYDREVRGPGARAA